MYKTLIFLSLFTCYLGKTNIKIQRSPDGRIVGGVDTEISEHPYQVSMELVPLNSHICGGSIMSNYLVVTAAHCVNWKRPDRIRIRAGISIKETGGTLHEVSNIFMHPWFNHKNYDHDIAVLKVSEPFVYSNNVKPIPLTSVEPSSGTPVIVTGWGRLAAVVGTFPNNLQKVQVYMISRDECDKKYGDSLIKETMICAGVPEGGKDACSGDSGGPLVSQGKLVGVVSWGKGCADMRYPGVYSNVAFFKKWVDSVTNSK